MKNNSLLLGGIFMMLVACFAVGLYLIFSKDSKPNSSNTTSSNLNNVVSNQPCQPLIYSSGARWLCGKPRYVTCPNLPRENSSVTITDNGQKAIIIVPAQISNGVRASDSTGKDFVISKGDKIEIIADGKVKFSDDHPCVTAGGMSGWEDPEVDSPFRDNVGGLEFSIGSLYENRYFAGIHYEGVAETSGVPIFRSIERLDGYGDNNNGAFTVTIKKSK